MRPPPTRRRRSRWVVVAGSILLHLALLLLLLRARPDVQPGPPSVSDEVSMVFDHPAGSAQASTPADNPSPNPTVASGRPDAPADAPSLDTTWAAPAPAPVEPPAPVSPAPTPPTPQTRPQPQPATVTPPAPSPPPTVSLSSDSGLPPAPPDFVMPQPPQPLPPLPPRPAPPRVVARPQPRLSTPFSNPQDWSLNGASKAPGRASRGMDFSLAPQGGKSESEMQWVAGARPSGDWGTEFHNWAQARVYYPEAARESGIDGTSVVLLEIDRSGKVLSVRMANSSGSPFLDGAWLDIFRNARVPAFTADMTEPTITMRATLVYRLIRR